METGTDLKYYEIAVFLTLAVGFFIGKKSSEKFSLGWSQALRLAVGPCVARLLNGYVTAKLRSRSQ